MASWFSVEWEKSPNELNNWSARMSIPLPRKGRHGTQVQDKIAHKTAFRQFDLKFLNDYHTWNKQWKEFVHFKMDLNSLNLSLYVVTFRTSKNQNLSNPITSFYLYPGFIAE